MTLGKYLKIQRLELGLTQLALAKKIGISNVQLSYYERDQRFPTAKVMNKLLYVLKLDKDLLKTYIIRHFTNMSLKYFSQFKPLSF